MSRDIIEGTAIVLKPIEHSHTPLIVKWRNNPNVMRNFIFQETFTYEMHTNWLNSKVASGEVVQYIIYEGATEKPIGSVYFRDIDLDSLSAEYGIFIGEDDARGNGYGSETAKVFVGYGFNTLKLKSIMLRVYADNVQAIASYKEAGFTVYETQKNAVNRNGVCRDLIFMRITSHEYESKKAGV